MVLSSQSWRDRERERCRVCTAGLFEGGENDKINDGDKYRWKLESEGDQNQQSESIHWLPRRISKSRFVLSSRFFSLMRRDEEIVVCRRLEAESRN